MTTPNTPEQVCKCKHPQSLHRFGTVLRGCQGTPSEWCACLDFEPSELPPATPEEAREAVAWRKGYEDRKRQEGTSTEAPCIYCGCLNCNREASAHPEPVSAEACEGCGHPKHAQDCTAEVLPGIQCGHPTSAEAKISDGINYEAAYETSNENWTLAEDELTKLRADLARVEAERDRAIALNEEMVDTLYSLSAFANGHGDVCDIVARRLRSLAAKATQGDKT